MINIAILAATGYTAREAINILLRHPQVRLAYLSARNDKCGPVANIFPALAGRLDLQLEELDLDKLQQLAQVVLCCLPHKESMKVVPKLLDAGLKVIDFSADYRFKDRDTYENTYQIRHTDKDNLARAAFGLPELFRDQIKGADLVANPGCYPTAAGLALAPLFSKKLITNEDIIINAVSGVSGAGRTPQLMLHFPEMNENFYAYGLANHRHLPEIEQILTSIAKEPVQVLFQPHLANMDRGIAATIYAKLSGNITSSQLTDVYQSFYENEPFVRILDKPPTTKDVTGTNFCDIYPTLIKDKLVIFSVLDNLIKGAAGQAIQHLNIICDLPETLGLL